MSVDYSKFLIESNRIEGINRLPTPQEAMATTRFVLLDKITVEEVEKLVGVYQPGAMLRKHYGMNVMVGNHVAPKGGPQIDNALESLLVAVNDSDINPYITHIEYEHLHPFTDGNGRSGRAIWLWQMVHDGLPIYGDSSFLHTFYYQTLAATR